MSDRMKTPFDSIENAQQYIKLLAEAVAEAKRDIGEEIALTTEGMSHRRLQALRVVEYNLEKLQRYLSASSRTLSDLRSLRRLFHGERTTKNGIEHRQATGRSTLTTTPSASESLPAGEMPTVPNL